MRTLILITLTIIFNSFLFSQVNHINCTIFIDGKLPERCTLNQNFSFTDRLGKEKIINFTYEIGEIIFDTNNYKLFRSLDLKDEIKINITHKDNNYQSKDYHGILKVEWLSYPYIIIRITNLKKNKYYLGISAPGVISSFIKEEYNMMEE
jgi:hypothetical protein